MNIDEYGDISFTCNEVIQSLYSDSNIVEHVTDEQEISKYNQFASHFGFDIIQHKSKPKIDPILHHASLSKQWCMPDQYKQIDVEQFLAKKLAQFNLTADSYVNILLNEIIEFKKRSMFDLIRFLIYMMDVCKQKNIVTGIGRGSSVSSLVLYLIGVHHIDPIKYNLDYKEFLR